MLWAAVVGFLVAITPVALTPGASFTLATQRTLAGHRNATAWVVVGTATGIYVHALLAAVGLSAVVMRSAQAFTVVKVLGGIYLVSLGAWTLWQTGHRQQSKASGAPQLPWTGRHSYPQAVLANVLNPKAASVYLTLAPQFLTADQVGVLTMLLLATVHVAVMAVWLTVWTAVLRRARRAARSDRLTTTVNRVGGAILIALGIRTGRT